MRCPKCGHRPDTPSDRGREVRQAIPALMMLKENAPSAILAMLAPLLQDALADYPPERDDVVMFVSTRVIYSQGGNCIYNAFPDDEFGARYGTEMGDKA